MASTKRPRKKNFSHAETMALIEQYRANKEILQSKCKTSVTNKGKQKAWSQITEAVNSVSLIGRSTTEIKEKWSKLSSAARLQLRSRRYPPTGNVHVTEMPELDVIADIFGDSAFIESVVVGRIDTGEPKLGQDSDTPIDPMLEVNGVRINEGVAFQLNSSSSCDDTKPQIQFPCEMSSVSTSQSNTPSTNQPSHQSTIKPRTDAIACDELYAKYLKISIEVKELKKEKLQMEIENLKRNSTSN